MNSDKIRVNPGRKASTTGESIENALAEAGIVLDYSPTIYMPQKRVNGVYWIALGKKDGDPIAIHGRGVASLAVKQGMLLTRYEGNLWHAAANSIRPRRKPPSEQLGNAIQWDAEPMIDRLNKCLGVLVGYDLVTEAVQKKIRDQISELRQERNDD